MDKIDLEVSEKILKKAMEFDSELKSLNFNNFNHYLILNIAALEYFLEQNNPEIINEAADYIEFLSKSTNGIN
jgi:hypothetical protein